MTKEKGTPASAPPSSSNSGAKVGNYSETTKDILKVLDYFRYTTGTTLDCAKQTGILRNSITWYVHDLEKVNLLQAVCHKPDTTTGRDAKHYSADPSKWHRQVLAEPTLFVEAGEKGGAA
jgi:hypothetical protein